MTAEAIITIIVAVLGSNLIQFFVTRRDQRKGIKDQLLKLEKDSCRTQLLVMMSDYPDEKNEIMTLGEHYFKVLKGDWYLTSLFSVWMSKNDVIRPDWFNGGDNK